MYKPLALDRGSEIDQHSARVNIGLQEFITGISRCRELMQQVHQRSATPSSKIYPRQLSLTVSNQMVLIGRRFLE